MYFLLGFKNSNYFLFHKKTLIELLILFNFSAHDYSTVINLQYL